MFKKIISYFLIFAIAISICIVPAFASASGSLLNDSASVTAWSNYFDNNYILGSIVTDDINVKALFWHKFDKAFSSLGLGSVSSYDELFQLASQFHTVFKRKDYSVTEFDFNVSLGRPVPNASIAYDSSLGVYRLRDDYSGLWLVNSAGHFPYYRETQNNEDDGTNPTLTYSWWFRADVPTGTSYSIVPEADLKVIAKQYGGNVHQVGNYFLILDVTTSKVLCASGHPLASIANLDSTAVDQTNNYYTNEGDTIYNEYQGGDTIINEGDTFIYEGDTITNNSTTVYEEGDTYNQQFIDIHDNIFQDADGNIYNIDNLYYDASTQSYYVNAHDEYVYNATTNNYVTNNYTFRVTYHVNYTSVTYIGQTEEFEADTYVYYYELPDGRSSADLTAEELEQISIAFSDVVNYARSTDVANMRVLFHFDGNVEDSSYWSYCTSLDWVSGASLTYLDEGAFNGSLYLDETEHEFSILLPNVSDVTGDFTLQFRYYQSHTESPVRDSYISIGDVLLLSLDGQAYYSSGSSLIAETSVGTWNEICIVSFDGQFYYYVNGVYLSSFSGDFSLSNQRIVFHFGSGQQTYKKIDELRFTRGLVYAVGQNYTPTAVPFDTNLTLILPDGERPVADEVLVITPAEDNYLDASGLSDWSSFDVVDSVKTTWKKSGNYLASVSGDLVWYNCGALLTDNGSSVGFSTDAPASIPVDGSSNSVSAGWDYYYPEDCLFLPIGNAQSWSTWFADCSLDESLTYSLTIVYDDGSYDCFTFDLIPTPDRPVVAHGVGYLNCDWLYPYCYNSMIDTYFYTGGLALSSATSGQTVGIAYMEIVAGTEPGCVIDWEFAMYSSGELENSPVLAVRSNTPISKYTFGGVRPSYPDRGQVWAMIEGRRIVSLQQYTGSAWVAVDGRIWTGFRWIPYGSFDVFTLQDCWDMLESGEGSDYEYIYSESGFWAWWQRQWLQFTNSLFSALDKISSGSGDVSVVIQNNTIIDNSDKEPFSQDDYKGIVKIMRKGYGFFSGFFGFIFDGVNGFIDHFNDTTSVFYGLFSLNGLEG